MYTSQLQDKEVRVLKTPTAVSEQPPPAARLEPDGCGRSGKCSCAQPGTRLCSCPVTLPLARSHEAAQPRCSSPAALRPRCAAQNGSVSGPCADAALVNSEVRNLIREHLYPCYFSLCVCRVYCISSVVVNNRWATKLPIK